MEKGRSFAHARIVLKKTSFVDYPGVLSAVFFFPGCNLRCPWCQNRELVLGGENANLACLEEGMLHLKKRLSILKAVVLSGGEPSIQSGLPDLVKETKALGLLVKLDTNGMNPQMLGSLFESGETRPDYIALDLKLALSRYAGLAASDESKNENYGERLAKSAGLIRASGIAHEFRSLALPGDFFNEADVEALAPLVDGESPWHFRPFVPGSCLDPAWDHLETPPPEAVKKLAGKAEKLGKNVLVHQ